MVSSTISRLIFFGGRYLSLLLLARLAGADAVGLLLAVAIAEIFRYVFDYGLENNILARAHQQDSPGSLTFARNKGSFRLMATLLGQCATSGAVAILCLKNDTPLTLPLVASLQFTCLMGFGYFQAHLQTGRAGGMAALIRPLAIAALLQGVLLVFAREGYVPIWVGAAFFEAMALLICAAIARRYAPRPAPGAKPTLDSHNALVYAKQTAPFRQVLSRIAPLGNVALIGVAYARLDALAVSWVASGVLLTQYLLYQRLASAPLMFFSTIASVNIARLSEGGSDRMGIIEKIGRSKKLAYFLALTSGLALVLISPFVATFFKLLHIDLALLGLQSLVLALQISNGFHAAFLIALHESSQLWTVARNNTLMAVLVIPLGAWQWQAHGIALALCLVEMLCAAQYVWLFREGRLASPGHA